MLNKLKKAIKYIVKKVKQWVKIMAKTAETGANVMSNMYKCKCEIETKKLDMLERAGSAISNGIKRAGNTIKEKTARTRIGYFTICIGVGLVLSGKLK